MEDSQEIQRYRELHQAWKEGSDNKQLSKVGDKLLPSKEKKLRTVQKHKIKCREVAEKIWRENPTITISGMIDKQEILDVTKRSDGNNYLEKTVRNWIKNLCPNREPGRRPEKQ